MQNIPLKLSDVFFNHVSLAASIYANAFHLWMNNKCNGYTIHFREHCH